MNIVERFINYTKFDTQSAEDSQTVPSTSKQLIFAKYLKEELEHEGLEDVEMDEKGYIYATLKSNVKKEIPTIGFISHYDTSPDASGANIKARIVKNYDGKDIVLSEGMISSPSKFPELKAHIGEDLIVTDGHTLLGADDKAGIAEIVQAMCYLRDHDEIKHGDIRIAFNPDEEIGMGAHHFDVEKFGCEWAYTMDGGDLGNLEYENFNAASAKIHIKGVSVHTGYAKGKMLNAKDVYKRQLHDNVRKRKGVVSNTLSRSWQQGVSQQQRTGVLTVIVCIMFGCKFTIMSLHVKSYIMRIFPPHLATNIRAHPCLSAAL